MTNEFSPSQLRNLADGYDESACDYGFDVRISDALRQAASDREDAERWRHFANGADVVTKGRGVFLEIQVMYGRADDKPSDYIDALRAIDQARQESRHG